MRLIRRPLVASLIIATSLLQACGGGGGAPSELASASGTAPVADSAATTADVPASASTSTGAGDMAAAVPGPGTPAIVDSGATSATGSTASGDVVVATPVVQPPLTKAQAWRLADQATFGATDTLLADIMGRSASAWVASQFSLRASQYTSGGTAQVHQLAASGEFCDQPGASATCWRDNLSTLPLGWDFYRNAVDQPDQLRQRVAFALQQIVVVSGLEVQGTYGFRSYQNMLLDRAFGNYRDVLRSVILSPVMGDYLNHVNNDKAAPNENFARELLQLFSIGTCNLDADGARSGGRCTPSYDNEMVRSYAYALTGWTFAPGGASAGGCWPSGANCRYYGADMVAWEARHDKLQRQLLAGVTLPAGQSTAASMEKVLDSLMAHGNTAPFIGRQLIQHLVTSNPSPAYVRRVSAAFTSGRYTAVDGAAFGGGSRGDLAATVAAVLLDTEARSDTSAASFGKLREPALMFTAVLRALDGHTDGEQFSWWWGDSLREHVFRAPSVFGFYAPDFPVAGTTLVGPSFGLHGADAALARLNFLAYLLDWGGSPPGSSVPGAIGTGVDLTRFAADAADPPTLVDKLSVLATGTTLPSAVRDKVILAVQAWTPARDNQNWKTRRVQSAAYLVFASPRFQVQR